MEFGKGAHKRLQDALNIAKSSIERAHPGIKVDPEVKVKPFRLDVLVSYGSPPKPVLIMDLKTGTGARNGKIDRMRRAARVKDYIEVHITTQPR